MAGGSWGAYRKTINLNEPSGCIYYQPETNEERDALSRPTLTTPRPTKPQNLSVRSSFGTRLGKVRVEFGEAHNISSAGAK